MIGVRRHFGQIETEPRSPRARRRGRMEMHVNWTAVKINRGSRRERHAEVGEAPPTRKRFQELPRDVRPARWQAEIHFPGATA